MATPKSAWQSGQRRRREYDNELLDAHFIAGDGRVNENIGLTAVHHVFHAEHNRLVDHTKDVILADARRCSRAAPRRMKRWRSSTNGSQTTWRALPADASTGLIWDGERLFQAAKFGTEMQYQHLVFEEFARKIQPNINVFLVPDGFDATIDPSIVAEFAHVVYRFGHSMLTEIDRPLRSELQRRSHQPDRGLPQPNRSSTGANRAITRRHRRRRDHPRHDPPGRQRDRRVRHRARCATICSACRSISRPSTWRAAATPACRR